MKAFLLAAGVGSRLRPMTDHTPKCLLPIGDTPLLDLWLDALHRAGVGRGFDQPPPFARSCARAPRRPEWAPRDSYGIGGGALGERRHSLAPPGLGPR